MRNNYEILLVNNFDNGPEYKISIPLKSATFLSVEKLESLCQDICRVIEQYVGSELPDQFISNNFYT